MKYRIAIWIVVSMAVGAAGKPPIRHAAPLSPFEQMMSQVQTNHARKRQDQFRSDVVDANVIGIPFKVTLPVPAGGTFKVRSPAWYSYGDGSLLYQLPMGKDFIFNGVDYNYLRFYTHDFVGREYIAQNAFGAKAAVTKITERTDGIIVLDAPSKAEAGADYTYSLNIDGPAARIVALDTALIIEGTYDRMPRGLEEFAPPVMPITYCQDNSDGPTVQDPTDQDSTNCVIGAHVKRIAFVRRSTGEVLKEWVRP